MFTLLVILASLLAFPQLLGLCGQDPDVSCVEMLILIYGKCFHLGKCWSSTRPLLHASKIDITLISESRFKTTLQMDVSENSGTPRSSILIGFSIINHPFWGTPIFGNTQMFVWVKHLGAIFSVEPWREGFPIHDSHHHPGCKVASISDLKSCIKEWQSGFPAFLFGG